MTAVGPAAAARGWVRSPSTSSTRCHAEEVADTPKPAVEERLAPAAMVKILNPVMRAILASPLHGIASKGLLVLHVRGRRTGKVYDVPVGRHELDGQLLTYGGGRWRVNLRGGADLEVTIDGRRRRPMPSWRRTRIASPRSSTAC